MSLSLQCSFYFLNPGPDTNYPCSKSYQSLRVCIFVKHVACGSTKYFSCINEAYQNILEKVMGIVDEVAPLKGIRIKGSSKPWFDGDVIERINVRDKLRNMTPRLVSD